MAERKVMKAILIQKKDTAENWEKFNPILKEGEFGYDITNKRYKMGDGVTEWKSLEFAYIGAFLADNEQILKTKKIATEDYVNEQESIFVAQNKTLFPSIGKVKVIYIDLESNIAYIWKEDELQYFPISSEATVTKEQIAPMVEEILNDCILYGGDSETI